MGALKLPMLVMLSGIQWGLDRRHHGFGPTYEMLYDGFQENVLFVKAFRDAILIEFTLALYHHDGIEVTGVIKNSTAQDTFAFKAVFEPDGSGGIFGSTTIPPQERAA